MQILLIAVAMVGFNQAWNVEEERPIGGRHDDPPPPRRPGAARTATAGLPPSTEPSDVIALGLSRRRYVEADDDGDWADGPRTSPAV